MKGKMRWGLIQCLCFVQRGKSRGLGGSGRIWEIKPRKQWDSAAAAAPPPHSSASKLGAPCPPRSSDVTNTWRRACVRGSGDGRLRSRLVVRAAISVRSSTNQSNQPNQSINQSTNKTEWKWRQHRQAQRVRIRGQCCWKPGSRGAGESGNRGIGESGDRGPSRKETNRRLSQGARRYGREVGPAALAGGALLRLLRTEGFAQGALLRGLPPKRIAPRAERLRAPRPKRPP